MRRTIEAIFRHPMQLLVLLILPIAIAGVVAYRQPRSYQSSASLWALHRFAIIGATGPESNLQAAPADTQVSALSELLLSREFALTVAKSTDLASTLNLSQSVLSNPQMLDDALALEVSQHVQVTSKGYNLFELVYTNRDPRVAQQVIAAVIQQFKVQGSQLSITEGQRLLQAYQTQLKQAKQDADAAASAEAAYLAAHPLLKANGTTSLNDPKYALLDSKRLQGQAQLENIQAAIATISQEITLQGQGGDAFFNVIDAPIVPDVSASRTKTFLTAGGIGAGIGLVACVLYILVLVRRDHAMYTVRDLQKVLTYPVLMQLPRLPPAMKGSSGQGVVLMQLPQLSSASNEEA